MSYAAPNEYMYVNMTCTLLPKVKLDFVQFFIWQGGATFELAKRYISDYNPLCTVSIIRKSARRHVKWKTFDYNGV